MFGFLKKQGEKKEEADFCVKPEEAVDKVGIQRRAFSDIMQTKTSPIGDHTNAWNWAMKEIAFFKGHNLDRNLLYAFEQNIVMNLTDCYEKYFDQFRITADDITSVIYACEELVSNGNADKAMVIAKPYLSYILSIKDEYLGKQNCIQNQHEAGIMLLDYPDRKSRESTKDNFAYFFVLYCRIIDNILATSKEDLEARNAFKREILMYAKDISPWNSTVWEALSRTNVSDSEYEEYIQKALRYSTREGDLYGLGEVYANMAAHYTLSNPELAQALCYFSRKYGGAPLAAMFILSKQSIPEITDENTAESLLKKAGIQIGLSDMIRFIESHIK